MDQSQTSQPKMFDIETIMLALEFFQFVLGKAPSMVELYKAGEAEQIQWDLLRPRSRAELEAEVDEHLKG